MAALLTLRQYDRHRTVANMYLCAVIVGIVAMSARMVSVVPVLPVVSESLLMALVSSWIAGYSLAASYSWKQKMDGFAKLRVAVRL